MRADKHVKAQVEGILRGARSCWRMPVFPKAQPGSGPVWVSAVVVVVHLPSQYTAIEVTSRAMPPWRSTTSAVGHTEFDRKFRVRTDAPGGPQAVIPYELADAHVAGTVPLWSVQGRELRVVRKPVKRVTAVDDNP